MMTDRKENNISARIPELVSAAILVYLAICMVRHFLLTIPFPYPVEYAEGVVANWILRLGQGLLPYPPISASDIPWLHNPYGPLYFQIAAPFSGSAKSVFMAPRMISAISFLVCAILLYRFCHRDLSPAASFAASALFAASPLVWRYAAMARVDMAALAVSIAAVFLMESAAPAEVHRKNGNSLKWLVSGVLAAAAILIKPLFAAALLAGAILAFRRDLKTFAIFAAGAILPFLITGIWILASGNDAIISHYTWMNSIGLNLKAAPVLLLTAAGRHPFVFAILLFGLMSLDRKSARWWFALFTTILLATSAKTGADLNYYLAPIAAAVMLAGPLLNRLSGRKREQTVKWCLAVQLAIFIPVAPKPVFTATYGQEVPAGQTVLTPAESDREIGRLLVEEIGGAEGPVLADDIGYVLSAGKQIQLQPFQYGWLVRKGKLDAAPLLQKIRDGYFSLIIIRVPRPDGTGGSDFPEQVVKTVEGAFKLSREIGPYRIYSKVSESDQYQR